MISSATTVQYLPNNVMCRDERKRNSPAGSGSQILSVHVVIRLPVSLHLPSHTCAFEALGCSITHFAFTSHRGLSVACRQLTLVTRMTADHSCKSMYLPVFRLSIQDRHMYPQFEFSTERHERWWFVALSWIIRFSRQTRPTDSG